jgi:hypothetical protein
VAIFPIALAAGFAIFCYFLGSSIKLRTALYKWYEIANPNSEEDLKHKMPLVTPLWIDPIQSKGHNIARLAILLVPMAIFIMSWYLISYSWTKVLDEDMRTTFPYNKELYKLFYQGLYIFSITFFTYGIVRIFLEWYNFNHKNH